MSDTLGLHHSHKAEMATGSTCLSRQPAIPQNLRQGKLALKCPRASGAPTLAGLSFDSRHVACRTLEPAPSCKNLHESHLRMGRRGHGGRSQPCSPSISRAAEPRGSKLMQPRQVQAALKRRPPARADAWTRHWARDRFCPKQVLAAGFRGKS